jgi:hypothetical protein
LKKIKALKYFFPGLDEVKGGKPAYIVITFATPKHRLFDGDNHFSFDSLAHATFLRMEIFI